MADIFETQSDIVMTKKNLAEKGGEKGSEATGVNNPATSAIKVKRIQKALMLPSFWTFSRVLSSSRLENLSAFFVEIFHREDASLHCQIFKCLIVQEPLRTLLEIIHIEVNLNSSNVRKTCYDSCKTCDVYRSRNWRLPTACRPWAPPPPWLPEWQVE